MIAAIELEKYMTNASIFRIIIYKFDHQKLLSLIFLLIIDKNTKVSLYAVILPLNLAINMRIESN